MRLTCPVDHQAGDFPDLTVLKEDWLEFKNSKGNIKMVNRHMKRCSTSLITREIKSKLQ